MQMRCKRRPKLAENRHPCCLINAPQVREEVNSPAPFAQLRFSADGKLLMAVAEGRISLLDAYNGSHVARFATGVPEGGSALEASFSPDGQYVVSGELCLPATSIQSCRPHCASESIRWIQLSNIFFNP